jgi:hypothetical protein
MPQYIGQTDRAQGRRNNYYQPYSAALYQPED